MRVRLIAVTKPVIDECDTAEELIAFCARVSNPKNQGNKATANKLMNTLLTEKHFSPLEMANLVIEIETTRDIARQFLRHRSMAFQEFSQRYAEVPEFSQPKEARLQDKKNRQNSIELGDEQAHLDILWQLKQKELLLTAEETYQWALDQGIAKEVARVVLPEGLTTSRLYANGTLRSWVHYCQLRMGNGTQKEHIEVAKACWNIVTQEFPSIVGIIENEV